MVQWLALSPHSKKVLGSNPGQGISVQGLLVLSVWVFPGYSGFLTHSKNTQKLGEKKIV